MADIPDVKTSITDNALGLVEPTDNVTASVGTCSQGTINTVFLFSDHKTISDTFGTGPLVEELAYKLAIGGGTVFGVRVENTSTPGVAGAVTHAGTGVSVMTVTGAPYDAYEVIIEILVAGTNPAAGTATFRYSLDGGDNYSGEIALPTSGDYAIPGTNLTLHFTAASLVAGDTYKFNCTAPGFNGTELTAALTALYADPRTWKHVHVIGSASTASAQATIATSVGTGLATQETIFRYTYAIVECPELGDGTAGDAALISAFASFANTRVSVCAGQAELVSVLTGRVHRRSSAWVISARRHKASISEDTARVRSGPIPGISKLWRDEQIHRGLDAARFTTLRTIIGKQGFWFTNGRIMSTAGSDFQYLQYREVMDVACTVARAALIEYLADDFRVNPLTHPTLPGAILEQDARNVEKVVKAKLRLALLDPNHVSDIQVLVNRTDNIISTQKLRVKVRILPKGYFRFIEADMGFTNPQLQIG